MKKIWSKNGRSRPKTKACDDDASLAPSEADLAHVPHLRSLILPDYDARQSKHAWVNATLNALSREFSEAQLKLFRLELRGSHLYFFRPPPLVDARLFKLDTFGDLPRADPSASVSKLSLDISNNSSSTMGISSPVLFAGDTSTIYNASDMESLRNRPPHSAGSLSSHITLSTPSGETNNYTDTITYFSPDVPHPDLKFDETLGKFASSSPLEALVHFYLFADSKIHEAPLKSLLCVMPMMSNFVAILRLLHLFVLALYEDKFGEQTTRVVPTRRVLKLFSHLDTHFSGFFLKADTASFLLKFLDPFARNGPAELSDQIAKFKSDMLLRQELLLTLVNSSALNSYSSSTQDPLVELNSTVFLNDIGLFEFAEAITEIDLAFFKSWSSSKDKSLLLTTSILESSPGDILYKKNPLIFSNNKHVHYLSRLLVNHLFLESYNMTAELRARILEKWIDLGCLLDKLGNMSLWLGISSVILSQPVLRLTSVWRHVSEDYIALIRKDWSLVLFELDRRHLATPFESVTFGSSSGTDVQTTFKDSFHIMAPRGLGKIYPKSRIIPYFGDLLVNNSTLASIDELDSVWKKIDYSFERWNEYLDSLKDSDDLISYNQRILRHYDASGFIFSNQSLNQVLCLGVKNDLANLVPQGLDTDVPSNNGTHKFAPEELSAKLHRLVGLNCDSINLETIMKYSLNLECSPPENYVKSPDSQSRNNSGSTLPESLCSYNDASDSDNISLYSSRLSGTKAEDKLPLFNTNVFKVDFDKYDPFNGAPDPSDINVDRELILTTSNLSIDADSSIIDELGKMGDVLNDDEPHSGLGIDVDNILNYEKFKEFSLEDLTDSKEDEWANNSDTKHNSIRSQLASEVLAHVTRYLPRSSSIDRLIDLMILDPRYFDDSQFFELSEYRSVFMLNYSTFITTKDLLLRLAHRFVHSGNAVISVMKKQYMLKNKKFDPATFGTYPNWEFDKEVNLTMLGKVDYKLLLKIQTNILKVLIVLINNFFGSFLNDLANKRVMIKLLKLYSNEILQWYNSSKIDSDLDKSFESLVSFYKRLKKVFVMKTYRPFLPPKIDTILLQSFKFTSTVSEVPINRNLPSHKNVQKIEKFLNKFNELVASFYKGITPQNWFTFYKILENLYENGTLLNYKSQSYDVSEDKLTISNVYDYLFTLFDSTKDDLVFVKLPLILQTLLSLFSKFKSYLLIQLCDPLVSETERLDRMKTLLIMAKICKIKMRDLPFVLEGNSGPIPSFIESAIVNAIYSPQSRYFAKQWVKAALLLNFGEENLSSKKFDSLDALLPTNITSSDLISSDEPLLPCIGWIVENMLDMNSCPSYHGTLINFNKRYILFRFIKELIVEDTKEYAEIQTESKEFDFLFLLNENLSHMNNVTYDVNEIYPKGFFETIIKNQYALIATEAQRMSTRQTKVSTEQNSVSSSKSLSKKISNSSLRRQSLNFKASASLKFRLGGLFTKPKGLGLGSSSDRVVSVRELPDCQTLVDPKQKPVLVIPLKDRKIFPVYLLPACFKIDTENSNDVCFLQAASEADAQDWLRKLNYANRHWFYSRSINSKQNHSNTTFGVPLDLVCARDGSYVPLVLTCIFNILEAEGLKDVGIYRIGTSLSELNNLKQEIDKTGTINIQDRGFDVHALTSCVKLYFRELPDAILTDDVIESIQPFKRTQKDQEGFGENEVQAYKSFLSKLPLINYCTLKALIEHLNKVYQNREHNKMNSSNLATVIGPALTEASNLDSLINNFGLMNYILEQLIEHYEAIFC